MRPDPLVIARRWDGLGGRLAAILNAWSMARALDLRFAFAWPQSSDVTLGDPRTIFSEAFLHRFGMEVAEPAAAIPNFRLTDLAFARAKELSRTSALLPITEIGECFSTLAFADESAEAAQARFRAGLFEIGWSPAVEALIRQIHGDGFLSGYSAIHVRAGDIVYGNWRQFAPVDKYTPTPLVEFAVETLSDGDRTPVVVMSDNQGYIRLLKSRFNMVRTADEILSSYVDLHESQRAFADILLLSRARQIVGPSASAFSRLAANLAGLTIMKADHLMDERRAERCIHEGVMQALKSAADSDVLRPLVARDICWFLDVCGDNLTNAEQATLARHAAALDPDFCGALNRSAVALALIGDQRAAEQACSGARRVAATATLHADPMVESLAASAMVNVIALGAARRVGPSLMQPISLGSITKYLGDGIDSPALLAEIRRDIEDCQALAPFQTNHRELLFNLRYLLAAMTWLTAADDRLRATARAAIRPAELPDWRPSGFANLRACEFFPHVTRNVEAVTIRIARALGFALAAAPVPPRAPSLGYVDGIVPSSTGVAWVHGWAHEPNTDPAGLLVAYAHDGAIVSGGVTFIDRPDGVADHKEASSTCGFAIPLPLSVPHVAGDLRSNIRIVDRSGAAR